MQRNKFTQKQNIINLKNKVPLINNDEGIWVTVKNGRLLHDTSTVQPEDGQKWVKVSYETFKRLKNAGKRRECRKLIDKVNGKPYYVKESDISKDDIKILTIYSNKECTDLVNINLKQRKNLIDLRQKSRISSITLEFDCNTYDNLTKNYLVKGHGLNADHVLALKQLGEYCINIRKALKLHKDNVPNLSNAVIYGTTINNVELLFGHHIDLKSDNIVRFAITHTEDEITKMADSHDSELAKKAVAIAINDKEYHRKYSPTCGGKQLKNDKILGDINTTKRHKMDGNLKITPTAIHRDIKSAYQGIATEVTKDLNGKTEDQVKIDYNNLIDAVGSYRKLYRGNVKNEVFNPDQKAYSYFKSPVKDKGVVYKEKTGVTAGEKADKFMIKRIQELSDKPQDFGLGGLFG